MTRLDRPSPRENASTRWRARSSQLDPSYDDSPANAPPDQYRSIFHVNLPPISYISWYTKKKKKQSMKKGIRKEKISRSTWSDFERHENKYRFTVHVNVAEWNSRRCLSVDREIRVSRLVSANEKRRLEATRMINFFAVGGIRDRTTAKSKSRSER